MSQWTHVAGMIRIDTLNLNEDPDEIVFGEIKDVFGNTVRYGDPEENWGLCNVPKGSEGSVQYKVIKTAKSSADVAYCAVVVWGDLRDYNNQQEIYEWVAKSCKYFMIRSCSVKIDVEFKKSYLVFDEYDYDKNETLIKIVEKDNDPS